MTTTSHTDQASSLPSARQGRAARLFFGFLALLLVAVVTVSILCGQADIGFRDIVAAFRTLLTEGRVEGSKGFIIFHTRLPRIVLSALVGAALSLSGACLQGIFKNAMADPYILGLSSGGALGAAVAISFGLEITLLGLNTVPLFALLGALLTALAVLKLGQSGGKVRTETLLLSGIAVNAFLSAIVSFLLTLSMEKGTFSGTSLYWWLMGRFGNTQWQYVQSSLPYILAGSLTILFYARDLNLLLLGEESALHLGLEVERTKKILLLAASLTAAAAVSVSGIIGFVGLVVPHIVRLVVGPDHRRLLPSAILLGAIYLTTCDTLARTLVSDTEMPLGILTAFTGVPFFLYLLKKSSR
ncbi:MAG: iron chelate uptake ABC transporter family permease subunit [Armatimonadetes bacterium]|nr:iron chelate uptake ABC transporter family permease subunit [Armatimonadota bacterium]